MAKKWSNLNLPGALHFVTGNVLHRISVFNEPRACEAFLETCSTLLHDWPCKLIAYVVMPDHFHLIANPRDGDIKGFIGALKSFTAEKIIESMGGEFFERRKPDRDCSPHQVWQESFKAMPLWSSWMIWQKINYIHANPVKARLVASANDYPWSSFRAFYSISNDVLTVDHDWWWPDDSEKLSKAMKELGWRRFHDRVSKE